MSVFRRRYSDSSGRVRATSTWTVQFRDVGGVRRRICANITSRRAAERIERAVVEIVTARGEGRPVESAAAGTLAKLPEKMKNKLIDWDILNPSAWTTATCSERIDQWIVSLKTLGRTAGYIELTESRVRKVCDDLAWIIPTDMNAEELSRWIAHRVADGASPRTINHYLSKLRQFVGWMVRSRMMDRSPIDSVMTIPVAGRATFVRRPISLVEFQRLLDVTAAAGDVVRGVAAADRAMLYWLCAETGLRHIEATRLKRWQFDGAADPPAITLDASQTKNRKTAVRPIYHAALAHAMRKMAAKKAADEPLLASPTHGRAAAMLRCDLQRAKIEYETPQGRFDFHALSRSLIAHTLVERGAPKNVLQWWMRHSSAQLTLDVYARATPVEVAGVMRNVTLADTPKIWRIESSLSEPSPA